MKDLNKFLPYCSNLDDCEYNSLWECYEEESLFKRFKNYVTNQIKSILNKERRIVKLLIKD